VTLAVAKDVADARRYGSSIHDLQGRQAWVVVSL